jgi:hypothetical protein
MKGTIDEKCRRSIHADALAATDVPAHALFMDPTR